MSEISTGALPRFRLSSPCTTARPIYPNASIASSLRRNRRGRLSASTMGQPMIRSRSCASTSDALPVRCALSSRRMRAARVLATVRSPWHGEAISCSWMPTTSWRRAALSWRSMRPAARMLDRGVGPLVLQQPAQTPAASAARHPPFRSVRLRRPGVFVETQPRRLSHELSDVGLEQAVSRLFRARGGYRFAEDVQRSEDIAFVYPALVDAERIATVGERLISYRVMRAGSAMATKDRHAFDFVRAIHSFRSYLLETGRLEALSRSYATWAMSSILYNLNTLASYPAFLRGVPLSGRPRLFRLGSCRSGENMTSSTRYTTLACARFQNATLQRTCSVAPARSMRRGRTRLPSSMR